MHDRGRVAQDSSHTPGNRMQVIDMQPWFITSLFDMGHPSYLNWHLSKQGICWPAAHVHIVDSSLELIKAMWFFEVDRWPSAGFFIGLRVHVWLPCCEQGWVVRKPVKANSGLKVNKSINFSCRQMFFSAFVLCILRLFKLKTEGQTIYRKPHCINPAQELCF